MRISLKLFHCVRNKRIKYLKVVITKTNKHFNVLCKLMCNDGCESMFVLTNERICECVCQWGPVGLIRECIHALGFKEYLLTFGMR